MCVSSVCVCAVCVCVGGDCVEFKVSLSLSLVYLMSSMEDLEVFPRQAVIVKNGKIFVEDEPFFCESYEANDGDGVKCEEKPDVDGYGFCSLDSNKSNDDGDDEDDFDSEKENRISHNMIVEHHGCEEEEEEEEEDDSDDDEEYDENERFLRLVDRGEFFEDVDGLRLQGLPDCPVDPAQYLDYIQ